VSDRQPIVATYLYSEGVACLRDRNHLAIIAPTGLMQVLRELSRFARTGLPD